MSPFYQIYPLIQSSIGNNNGVSVLEKLIGKDYPNLYYSVKGTHEYVEQHKADYMSNSVPGFTNSSKTRPLIVAKMEEYIRNRLITVRSSRLFHEFKTYICISSWIAVIHYINEFIAACDTTIMLICSCVYVAFMVKAASADLLHGGMVLSVF